MTILQLAPQFPFPMTDGGKISIGNITRHASELGHEVHLLAVSSTAVEPHRIDEARRWAASVTVVQQDTSNSPLNMLRSLFSPLPLYVHKFVRPAVFAAVDTLCDAHAIDCIHADHSSMIPLALHAAERTAMPVGLRLHNVEWLIWQRYAERFPLWSPARWYLQLQASRLRRYETTMYSKFAVCFPIAATDAERARAMAPHGRYVTATAGVNMEEWQPDGSQRDAQELILATTYDWVHNVDGVLWLIERVLPLVQRSVPGVHLSLLGKNAPERLVSLGRNDVDVKGFVPSVVPFFSRAGIYVAPLFVGGGMRIKILEAMAMELPVVATSVAAEGIGASERDGLFRADTPEEFAAHIASLASQPVYAREAGERARAFIEQHFSWRESVRTMLAAYERLLFHV